jgi:hypothetical protein
MAHVMSFLSKVNGKYDNRSSYQRFVKHDLLHRAVMRSPFYRCI